MTYEISQQDRSTGIGARIVSFFSNFAEAIERRRAFERVYSELASLSDRELSDIGLSRSQIVDIAWESSEA